MADGMAEDSTGASSDDTMSEPSSLAISEPWGPPSSVHYCAQSKAALFVGIAVTYRSLAIGLAKYRFWQPAMHAFRQVNDQFNREDRPSLPEELTLMVENYLREEGQIIGEEEVFRRDHMRVNQSSERRAYSKSCPARHRNKDEVTLADRQKADKEYMHEVFSLSIEFGTEPEGNYELQRKHLSYVYLCIPWSHRWHSEDARPGPKMMDNHIDDYAGVEVHDSLLVEQQPDSCLVDQDLTITEDKVLSINRAIRELGLDVSSKHHMSRQTAEGAGASRKDFKFKSTTSPDLGTIWQPRVILLLGCSLRMDLY